VDLCDMLSENISLKCHNYILTKILNALGDTTQTAINELSSKDLSNMFELDMNKRRLEQEMQLIEQVNEMAGQHEKTALELAIKFYAKHEVAGLRASKGKDRRKGDRRRGDEDEDGDEDEGREPEELRPLPLEKPDIPSSPQIARAEDVDVASPEMLVSPKTPKKEGREAKKASKRAEVLEEVSEIEKKRLEKLKELEEAKKKLEEKRRARAKKKESS